MSHLGGNRAVFGTVRSGVTKNDGLFFGKVQGIRSLISYEGTNISELVLDFHGAIDDYLKLCEDSPE